MKNIVVVSLKDEKAQDLASKLAAKLKYNYVDFDDRLEEYLLATIDIPTILVDEILNEKESELLDELVKEQNVVLTLANDTFLSNENYKLLKNCIVVLISVENLAKVQKKLEEAIQKYSNVVVNENCTEIELFKLIKNK